MADAVRQAESSVQHKVLMVRVAQGRNGLPLQNHQWEGEMETGAQESASYHLWEQALGHVEVVSPRDNIFIPGSLLYAPKFVQPVHLGPLPCIPSQGP